jgi:hypothetical protein
MDQPKRCKCGCGREVNPGASWIRGHASRGEGGYRPFPSPDQVTGEILADIGELVPDDEPTPPVPAQPADDSHSPSEAGPAPDEPPAHATREWRRAPKRKSRAAPPKITGSIRADIDAKISFALEVPGRVWQARDPVCGTVFVQQRAEISGALTDIVCQSADLVKWFAGPGGNFMLFMNLAAACWPVATVAMAHHVYHSIEDEAAPEPDYQRYAA